MGGHSARRDRGRYGLGPVGQFAARAATVMGAERVFGVDLVPERPEMARRLGVEVVDASAVDNVPAFILEQTQGRGPDSVIDAVGMEAHGNPVAKFGQEVASRLPGALGEKAAGQFGVDRLEALLDSIATVRRGGTLSVSGVYGGAIDPLPMLDMLDKGIQIRMGQCHVRRWIAEIMPYLEDDTDPLGTADMASHYLRWTSSPGLREVPEKGRRLHQGHSPARPHGARGPPGAAGWPSGSRRPARRPGRTPRSRSR